MELILKPFSVLLLFLYDFLHSYGLALIVFSLLVKIILFPFSLKGKKSMIQMNLMQGKMQQIQKQYGKDKARYNQEIQLLYEKEKINPMGGCLWSLLPMAVLILLYYIVREPITYLMGVSKDLIDVVANTTGIANTGAYPQIAMANAMNDPAVLEAVKTALGDAGSKVFALDFSFFGINLSTIPTWKFWTVPLVWSTNFGPLLLILISVCANFLSMWISQKTNKLNNQQSSGNSQADRMTKQMMFMMPLMSLWIGFIAPSGLCVYWIANSLFTMLQELICGKILKKDYEKAAAARAEQERLEKEEQKRLKAERAARIAAEQEEAKKNKGKKKPAAPKPAKKKESTTEEGRIGMRPYARGRSYDPNRFGGVTEYHDTGAKGAAETDAAPAPAVDQAVSDQTEETAVLTGETVVEEAAPVLTSDAVAEPETTGTDAAEESTETQEEEEVEEI